MLLPTHTLEGLAVPTTLVAALMQFASPDPTRTHMSGLGLDDGHLCATDGHTACRVMGCDPNGAVPSARDGSCWSGDHVRMHLGIAKASKSDTVLLAWDQRLTDVRYPPVHKVVGAVVRSVKSGKPVGADPYYLARLLKVAEAVQGSRRSNGGELRVVLVHADGLDPLVYEVPGTEGRPTCEVAIMPVRLYL